MVKGEIKMKRIQLMIGDIIWVKFEGKDHIQNGVRPAVVIQNNKGNFYSPTVQVVPLTSKMNKAKLPTHCIIRKGEITGLKVDSIAQCEGSRLISQSDVIGKIGKASDVDMKNISKCCLVNNPFLIYFTGEELVELQTELCLHNIVA